MRNEKQVCISCRVYIFIWKTVCLTCLRSSCICGWADYPGSRGSVLSHLARRNQTGTTRRSHWGRLLITKPHTLSLVRLYKTHSQGLSCLPPAFRREQAVVGGFFGTMERTVWSPLWWQFPDTRQKKESCLTRTELTFYEFLTRLSFFCPLTSMFPHWPVANINPAVC